jgi:hypothetical protein
MRGKRMAEMPVGLAMPVRLRTSLRRHYPHQVQGVRLNDVSAIAAPPHLFHFESKTRVGEVKPQFLHDGHRDHEDLWNSDETSRQALGAILPLCGTLISRAHWWIH